jgi:hypothetical protein
MVGVPEHGSKEVSKGDVAFVANCLSILHELLKLVSIGEHLLHIGLILLQVVVISHDWIKRVSHSFDFVVFVPVCLTVNTQTVDD